MKIKSDKSLLNKTDKKPSISRTKTRLMSKDFDTIDDESFIKRKGILKIVAKTLSLFGTKYKKEKIKHENKLNFNSRRVIMPISMKPNVTIENLKIMTENEINNRKRWYKLE